MKTQLLYLLTICGLLSSCTKSPLPEIEEESSPVFYFKCNVNGMPLKIEAGVNNYFMDPANKFDDNNIYVYTGDLKQKNCTGNCGVALSVQINDFKFSDPGATMEIDKSLKAGTYLFNDGTIKPSYFARFNVVRPKADNFYEWGFSDGTTSNGTTVTKSLVAGKNPVSLKSTDGQGSSSSLTREFLIGNPLQSDISMTFDGNGESQFNSSSNQTGLSYLWNFGDGTGTSTEAAPKHLYTLNANSEYKTTLMIKKGKDTCISHYLVKPEIPGSPNFTSVFTPVTNPAILSAITIVFTDQNGVIYSSADIKQPTSSKFEIVSVENYDNNAVGEATKKIKINFTGKFKSDVGIISITEGEAVVAVSYK